MKYKGVSGIIIAVMDAIRTGAGVVLRWPATDGAAGQVLTTNGSGQLQWATGVPAEAPAVLSGTTAGGYRVDNALFEIPWGYDLPENPTYSVGSLLMGGPVDGTTRIGKFDWATVTFASDVENSRLRVVGEGSKNPHLELAVNSQKEASLSYDLATGKLTIDALGDGASGILQLKTAVGTFVWPVDTPTAGQVLTVASVVGSVFTLSWETP